MKRILMLLIVVGFAWCTAQVAYSYLLPADYVVQYMLKKRQNFSALEVKQGVEFYDSHFPGGRLATHETLYLQNTGDFRIDGTYTKFAQTWVNQGGKALIITDGVLTDEGRYQYSLLRELFIAADAPTILARLQSAGVDTRVVSFGRNEKQLVYILGAKEGDLKRPQVWIAKDLFVPVRLIVSENAGGKLTHVDFRFSVFGKGTPSWYPAKTDVYFDDVLTASIQVDQASQRGLYPGTFFDVQELKRKVPMAKSVNRDLIIASTRIGDTLSLLRKQY